MLNFLHSKCTMFYVAEKHTFVFRKEEFFWDCFLAHVHYILYMYETCVKLFTEDLAVIKYKFISLCKGYFFLI